MRFKNTLEIYSYRRARYSNYYSLKLHCFDLSLGHDLSMEFDSPYYWLLSEIL